MSLEPDLLADRRRLKRRLSWWRAFAVLFGVAALALAIGLRQDTALPGLPHIARLPVRGFISDDRRVIQAIDDAARNDSVRALIVAIDSPGGSVAGGEALHAAITRFAAQKPVIAVMGGTAASAGYMTAVAAHHILARASTVTGSIGVLLQSFDASELLARLGVRPETIASGALKDQPSPFHPLSEEGRAALNRIVQDMHGQFVALVAAGRHMEEAQVRSLADGRIFTGREALALGLIDGIGGEREARAWLASERGIAESTPVRDLTTRSRTERLLDQTIGSVIKILFQEWVGVDAPRALWQGFR